LLAGLHASCRFDVDAAGSWRVLIADGWIHVTESQDMADSVIRLPEDVLLRLARGELNLTTAMLRGQVEVDGDLAIAERLARALFRG
jgi:putative sterol carrier protein